MNEYKPLPKHLQTEFSQLLHLTRIFTDRLCFTGLPTFNAPQKKGVIVKKLYILRHAEPDRSEGYSDFDCPLSKHGVVDAKHLTARLKIENIPVDKVVASAAKRTAETAQLLADGLGCKDVVCTKKLYSANLEKIAEVVRGVDGRINSLLIVGHNPGVTEFVDNFSDKLLNDWMMPCELVVLKISDWTWHDFRSGVISAIYSPGDFNE
jgi:phosphohistidine phosphatase